jgi:hypothetical protein
MFLIQTGQAKRLRKYTILAVFGMFVTGAFGAVLTMHWYVRPSKK